MVGKIVLQLLGRHEHGVQEILHLQVASLGLGEYLTVKVHQSMDLQSMAWLLPFDHKSGADHVGGRREVE
jgi:hypothetical protein